MMIYIFQMSGFSQLVMEPKNLTKLLVLFLLAHNRRHTFNCNLIHDFTSKITNLGVAIDVFCYLKPDYLLSMKLMELKF